MAGNPLQAGLFTVEQLELIRRLRNSGVSKEQIVTAFDTLERLEKELGHIYNIPVSLTAQIQCMQSLGLGMVGLPIPPHLQNGAALAAAQVIPQQPPQMPNLTPSPSAAHNNRKRPHEAIMEQTETGQNLVKHETNGYQSTVITGIEEEEDSEEFIEFSRKGDSACFEEIRQFVATYNIRQQQVAILAGVSQSYVSRYLKGDFHDMSERSRRSIQRWYIKYKNDPGSITKDVNMTLLCNSGTGKRLYPGGPTAAEMPTNPDFINYPKRERFVFRPSHIEVLEKYYMEDNYPSQEKRDEIARMCNMAAEVPGRILSEREKVTSQIIANWFANKRKEMKKLAREEGLDVSQVPLRGRGRPRLLNSDYALLSESASSLFGGPVPSSAMDENTTSIVQSAVSNAMNIADSQLSNLRSSSPDDTATDLSTNKANGNTDLSISEKENHRTSPPVNGGKENGRVNGQGEDSQSLSLAVEVAAVNQAILALSGTTPIEIKPETPD